MMNFMRQKTQKKAGFSLIEVIVSMSIFLIAILVIIGALISLTDASRKARAIRVVTDNLSAALDSMSRNTRMGGYYHCGCGNPTTPGDTTFPDTPRDCAMADTLGGGGDACFAFEGQFGDPNDPNDQIVYRLFDNRIQRSVNSGTTFKNLTAPEIHIDTLRFYVHGTQLSQDQPMVTMVLRGVASTSARTATDFNIQTTISSRTPNFDLNP